ncbi:MAG: hypothetical protein K1060chlam4_00475 [Candidatus Anoxychlamydiales bacterium]|nr:hypothetical protein [Candidatus Anoxychlamydiales bacterium]
MNRSLQQSIKHRLKQVSKMKNQSPAELWQILVLERILVRLINSKYKDNFVLKGGLLLSKYIDLGRETRDLDFVVKNLKNETKLLFQVFEEISKIDVEDGFIFKNVKVNPLSHFHMKYQGSRILMDAYFFTTRFKVQVDLGFGDKIDPIDKQIELIKDLKGPLFESHIEISSYPKEFIFAEKLETIINRSYFNSRMKDYHDLYFILSKMDLDIDYLKKILHLVFKHRKTKLEYPILQDSIKIRTIQEYWKLYHKVQRSKDQLPGRIDELIDFINKWLKIYIFS